MKRKINLINGLFQSLYSIKLQLVISILFCITFQIANSQTFHIPDSLKDKTYKELSEGLNSSGNDISRLKNYAKTYLYKAKNEKDTIKIANAYSQFASINNSIVAIKYCDSIINLTENLNNYVYPGFGYLAKGMVYFNFGNDQKALDNYLIAHQYASRQKNIEQSLYIQSLIGKLKNFTGKNEEALKSFKTIINTLEKKKNINHYNHLYLGTLFSISNSFILSKKYDSALVYSIKGINKSLIEKSFREYYNFVSQVGYIAYYQNNYEAAIDSLDKALPFESSSNGFLNDHYYRGNIFLKQNNEKKAFYHFKKVDSIYNSANEVVKEVRDIQEFFVNYYRKKNDLETELFYINRLLKVDSILTSNNRYLIKNIGEKYDIPNLIAQKEKIINNLKAKHHNSLITILGLAVILIVFILYFIWSNSQQKTIVKPSTNLLIEPVDKNEVEKIQKPLKEQITISQEVIDSVLSLLNEFETNHDYLENKLTMNKLSKKLNTNSNYLSKIINTHKQMNFSSYISNLRIEYCLQKMKNDSKFRKYTINAIAFEIGFNNVESFSKAFYKKTNTYPSSYIKEIEKSILA